MADEVRECIRAAQAAEIRNDKAQAIEMLRRAAMLYHEVGNFAREAQMLRQVRRLDGSSEEESKPSTQHFIERGPVRADPHEQAWCSFCCRPQTEVGALIGGPTGAFICRGCISECETLLSSS